MLANSSSSVSSASNSLEGVQPVQGHISSPDASAPAFPSPYAGNDGEKEGQEESSEQKIQQEQTLTDSPEIFRLTLDKDFQGVLDRFLTSGHEKILDLRSEMRKQRGVKESSLFFTGLVSSEEFQALRKYLYQVQIDLFNTPKGARLDTSL